MGDEPESAASSSPPAGAAAARQIPIVCPGHSRPLAEVIYCPETGEGTFLISGCHAKTPMLRRADTGDWIGTFEGHKGAVWGVALDDKAMLAATGSADFTARLWDAITGEQKHEFVHKHIVKSVEFSRDGTKLATGGAEGMLRIFDVATPDADPTMIPVSRAEGKLPTITKVRWGQEPWMLLTGSSDGMVRAWDTRTSADSAALEVAVDGGVMDLEVSRVQPLVTVASGDHVTFLHAGSLKEVKTYRMPINFKEEGGASLHPQGGRFIAGGSDLWVRVFDFETGAELECHKGHHGPVRCMRFHPDGQSYATGSEDGTIRIWSTTTT